MIETATRDLFSFAAARVAGELVELRFLTGTAQDDGSVSNETRTELIRAGFYDLTTAQIQRLETKGVTVQDGAVCVIPAQLPQIPDSVIRGMAVYKVVDYTNSEGVTTLTLSKAGIGFA